MRDRGSPVKPDSVPPTLPPELTRVMFIREGSHVGNPLTFVGTTDGLWDVETATCVEFSGHEVRSLSRADDCLFTVLDRREIWRRNGGGKWELLTTIESSDAVCVSTVASTVFVGTSEPRLYAWHEGALDHGTAFLAVAGRESWFSPSRRSPEVRSIASSPSGTVFANIHVGGIVRSSDGGQSWEPTVEIDVDVHQVWLDAASDTLFAASAIGLGISGDGGDSWRFVTEGLHAEYLRAVAVVGETVLVSASTGPSAEHAAVYRMPSVGRERFDKCVIGLPEWFPQNIDTFCLDATALRAVFATSDGRVFGSDDAGHTWTQQADGLPRVLSIVI